MYNIVVKVFVDYFEKKTVNTIGNVVLDLLYLKTKILFIVFMVIGYNDLFSFYHR